jgi:hypothetical protein
MKTSQRIIVFLEKLNLILKLVLLMTGAVMFFILFPFLLKYGLKVYILFFTLLILSGITFRIVAGKKAFKVIMWLWAGGSIIYLIIAFFLIIKGVQPLLYMKMDRLDMILYYVSYPLRVLGIFFTGLIFSSITSPVEFLRWGGTGLKIALVYRSFEYSANSFETNMKALIIQGEWPDFSKDAKNFRGTFLVLKSAPMLVATTFRNLIMWFPWAWICYNTLKNDVDKRREK